MPALTRKRVNNRPVTWHVHYAGVRVGVIVERSGARLMSGNEFAASTPAAIPATSDTAPRRVSRQPARLSRRHGETICPSGAKPTSRNGATKRRGRLRNIAALTGTSACRLTGNRNGPSVADRGWKRPFDDPIPLPAWSPPRHARGRRQIYHEASQDR